TIYYPLQLFSEYNYGTSLDVYVDSKTYDTDEFYIGLAESKTEQKDVPYLDVSATYKEDGEVIINVVNRDKDEPITTDIISQKGEFSGELEVYEVNGPDIKAENDFDQIKVQTEQKQPIKSSGTKVTYTFRSEERRVGKASRKRLNEKRDRNVTGVKTSALPILW